MNSHSLVAIDDLSRQDILALLERARYFEQNPNSHLLDGRVVATLFSNRRLAHDLALRLQ